MVQCVKNTNQQLTVFFPTLIPSHCDHGVCDAASLNSENRPHYVCLSHLILKSSAVSSTKAEPVIKMAKQAPGILGSLLRRCHSLHAGVFST